MMNNYINEYYQQIKDGSIVAGKLIKEWYKRIIKGLEKKSFYYAPKKAKAAIMFIENFCSHQEGPLSLKPFTLELWEKALISVIFGIVDENGNRQFREIVLIIGRKNGKTLLAAAIAEYMTFMDGEYGAKIYFCAPKLQQANLCFDAFCQIIAHNDKLSSLAQKRRTDIYVKDTNTSATPLAYNAKKSDGLNIHLGVCDEIASWGGEPGLKFYEVLKSSMGARTQPMLLTITTAGYENESIYDELFRRSTRVILGDSKETRLAPFIYQIDDLKKWNDINELQKANPNLGVSVKVDYMLEEIAIAEGSLSKKSEFITKYCCLKQNSSQAWLSAEVVQSAGGKEITLESLRNSYCVGGIDLSRTTDLTSCCIVVEKNGELYVVSKFFLPTEKIQEATATDGLPYQAYIQRGLLQPSGDNFIDYHDCYSWFTDLIEKYQIYPLAVGYDRYTAQYLVQDLKAYGFNMDDVFQGTNLTPVIREFEGLLKDGNIHIGNNDLLKVHMLDSALKMETDTERVKLVKLRKYGHIDGMAALLDAMTVRQKWYDQYGGQLKNEG